jgi:small GTP-binding protein
VATSGTIDVSCSKGTYIRTLGEEIGARSAAALISRALRRTSSGALDPRAAARFADLGRISTKASSYARLLPPDALVAALPRDRPRRRRRRPLPRRRAAPPRARRRAGAARLRPRAGAFLGTGHVAAGELIATRLLSPPKSAISSPPAPAPVRFRKPFRMTRQIRNIAIIAHVDHGKTTLVDQLLRQSGTFRANEKVAERVMDSNDLERERGITILAKNCAVEWKGTHVNIVDTPGHADFGGEVERVLSMVDSVLLLVDAVEGPMPQTRFVTKKALALGLKPIVVVNKVDRPGAREDYVVNATFDLFDKLGASEQQLDFPVVFASGLNGWATLEKGADRHRPGAALRRDPRARAGARRLARRSAAAADLLARLLDLRRPDRHRPRQPGHAQADAGRRRLLGTDSTPIKARVNQVLKFEGLERQQATEAGPGDIVLINGIEGIGVGVTLTDLERPLPLPMLRSTSRR